MTPRDAISAWWRVMTAPKRFFATLPRDGSLRNPLIFLTVCLGANVVEFVTRQAMRGFPIFAPFLKRGWGPVGLTFLFTPIAVTWLALPLVWAFFLSVGARYLGATGDLRRTLRIVCYASAPLVLNLPLPGIGLFVWPYTLYLATRGLQQLEGWSAGRALAAVAIALPAVIGVCLITVVPYLGPLLYVSVWFVLLFGPWSAALMGAFRYYLRNSTGGRPTLDPRLLRRGR